MHPLVPVSQKDVCSSTVRSVVITQDSANKNDVLVDCDATSKCGPDEIEGGSPDDTEEGLQDGIALGLLLGLLEGIVVARSDRSKTKSLPPPEKMNPLDVLKKETMLARRT